MSTSRIVLKLLRLAMVCNVYAIPTCKKLQETAVNDTIRRGQCTAILESKASSMFIITVVTKVSAS